MESLAGKRALGALLLVLAGVAGLVGVVGCGGEVATPTATAVAAPTLVASPERDAASPTGRPAASLGERAWETTLMLAEELSPRESATEEELAAAEWLMGRFSGWGYEVEMEEFEAFEMSGAVSLMVRTPEGSGGGRIFGGRGPGDEVWLFGFPVDPSTRRAEGYEVEGTLAYAGQGTEEDFSGVDFSGRIVLIETGAGASP